MSKYFIMKQNFSAGGSYLSQVGREDGYLTRAVAEDDAKKLVVENNAEYVILKQLSRIRLQPVTVIIEDDNE